MNRRKLGRHDLRVLHVVEADKPDVFRDSIPQPLERYLQLDGGGVVAADERLRATAPEMRPERRHIVRLGLEVTEAPRGRAGR